MNSRLYLRKSIILLIILWAPLLAVVLFVWIHGPNLYWRLPVQTQAIQPSGHGPNGYIVSMGTDVLSQTDTFKSPAILLEDGRSLGPGNALHERIGKSGAGRFSFWKGSLYFSSSDNSDPRINGRSYILAIPYQIQTSYLASVMFVMFLGSVICIFYMYRQPAISFLKTNLSLLPNASEIYNNPVARYFSLMLNWIRVNIIPGVSVTVMVLAVVFAGGEAYLRRKLPFNQLLWPANFDERFGWNFTPGATVNWTNYLDFWTSTQVNSLGFLDREPPLPGDLPNACRVAFIGDSFVEAEHVPIEDKMQVRFEETANEDPLDDRTFRTVAFGYSGTGQSNQIPFYDVFAKPLKPDVVVLVFVANDFANNSTTLESIRYGWHPLHPPRLFFEYDRRTNTYSRIEIDPNWQDHLLPVPSAPPPVMPNIARATTWLSNNSYLYNQMNSMFFKNSPGLSAFLNGNPPVYDVYKARLDEIKKMDKYADDFGNWTTDVDIDRMFTRDELPPAFEDAISVTGYALDQFKERGEKDNFKLIILTSFSVKYIEHGEDQKKYFNRVLDLANERDIPLVDQYDFIISKGLNLDEVFFQHDGHLNVLGHQTAADALWEYFQVHPEICD